MDVGRTNCKGCFYEGTCEPNDECLDYTPVGEMTDGELELYLDEQRIRFRREWFDYLGENGDFF